jgi:hypothetical protein
MQGQWRIPHQAENDDLMAQDTFDGLVKLLKRFIKPRSQLPLSSPMSQPSTQTMLPPTPLPPPPPARQSIAIG